MPEDYILLKLTPCHQKDSWYRWEQEVPAGSPAELVRAAHEFSALKIGYRGDLAFGLQERAADLGQTRRHIFGYFVLGSYRVAEEEATASLYGGLSNRFVTLHQHLCHRG